MHFLAKNLRRDGWIVHNWDYPSREAYIVEHGNNLVKELIPISKRNPGEPIHFLCHSMGSLVLLSALNQPDCPSEAKIGRVVLITPPIKGSQYARKLDRLPLARWFMKDRSGHELRTKEDFTYLGEFPDSLEKVLVIAGNLGFNPFINGKNDGTLSVEETELSFPHKRVILRRGHMTSIFSKRVFNHVSDFFLEDPEPLPVPARPSDHEL